jgi:hypothetical protein
VLKVNVSLENAHFVSGPDEIINYLIKKELIIKPVHLTYSGWTE